MSESLEYLVEKGIFGKHDLGLLKHALDHGSFSLTTMYASPKHINLIFLYRGSETLLKTVLERYPSLKIDTTGQVKPVDYVYPETPEQHQTEREFTNELAALHKPIDLALSGLVNRQFLIKDKQIELYKLNPVLMDSVAAYFRTHNHKE